MHPNSKSSRLPFSFTLFPPIRQTAAAARQMAEYIYSSRWWSRIGRLHRKSELAFPIQPCLRAKKGLLFRLEGLGLGATCTRDHIWCLDGHQLSSKSPVLPLFSRPRRKHAVTLIWAYCRTKLRNQKRHHHTSQKYTPYAKNINRYFFMVWFPPFHHQEDQGKEKGREGGERLVPQTWAGWATGRIRVGKGWAQSRSYVGG